MDGENRRIRSSNILMLSPAMGQTAGEHNGRGSVTGDPAASTANPSADPNAMRACLPIAAGAALPRRAARDEAGDQGRDKVRQRQAM